MIDNVKTMSLDDLLDELVRCGTSINRDWGMIPEKEFIRSLDIKDEIKRRCGEGN